MEKLKKASTQLTLDEINEIKRQAQAGSAPHQNQYGLLLALGQFVPKNKSQAVEYFKKASDQDNPEGMWNYCKYLLYDPDGPADVAQALEILLRGCEKGYPFILNQMAYFYQHGHYVEKNLEKAVELFRRGAELGSPQAQFNLATMYASGEGLEFSEFEAFEWLEKAAYDGDFVEAIGTLGEFYALGIGCLQDLDKGLELLEMAVGRDHPNSMFALGSFYYKGEIVERDYDQARFYLGKAVNRGFLQAYPIMASLLAQGLGGPKDLETAKRLLQAGAKAGLADCAEAYQSLLKEPARDCDQKDLAEPCKKNIH